MAAPVRQLDVRELALRGHDHVPDLALHSSQLRLLLRAQHVHGRDGPRTRRLPRIPTAPLGFLPEWGFTDTVAGFVGETAENSANVLYNPFAAVPSMHVAFALMISVPAFFLVRNRLLKALWAVYPAIVTLVVMVTANHLARRRPGRARGRRLGLRRQRRVRARPPGGLGLAHGRRQGARVTDELRERPRRETTARPRQAHVARWPRRAAHGAEIRTLARSRLVESRLTPTPSRSRGSWATSSRRS